MSTRVRSVSAVHGRSSRGEDHMIRDLLPEARRVTVLADAIDPFSKPFLEQIKLGGGATGTTINAIGSAAMRSSRPLSP